jgi:MoaA/NifB/PqqE/SkfB family radical SAM enzyme
MDKNKTFPFDKSYYLNDSKVFCMFPWLHLNVTPKGDVYPCCSNNYTTPMANTRRTSLEDAFNCQEMKSLRTSMLNDVPSKICEFCYKHEEASPHSFRQYSKEHFGKYFDEIVPTTESDGTVSDFKMRYFDIRFSNICNFKCRTCGAEFSSQWAKEMRDNHDPKHPIVIHADPKGKLLEEVLIHIDHIDLAYFAGGEPLITDEHYTILEEMIRKNRTDIILRYNTNASNIKYKNHDVVKLWKHFKKIELSCSIDHYGERAEWLRKGTDWGKVESNLKTFRELEGVSFQINTVFSLFNYYTITDFYNYLISKDIIKGDDWHHTLYLTVNPSYYSATSTPKILKQLSADKANNWIHKNQGAFPVLAQLLTGAIQFADKSHTWTDNKERFFQHVLSTDRIRKEGFFNVFPELNKFPIWTE